jgi:hypothetical protein
MQKRMCERVSELLCRWDRKRLCVRVNAHPSHRPSAEMKRRSTPYTKDHEFLKSLLAMDPLDPKDPPPSAPIFNPVPPESELFDLIQMVRPSRAMHKLSCPLAIVFRYVFASRIASGSFFLLLHAAASITPSGFTFWVHNLRRTKTPSKPQKRTELHLLLPIRLPRKRSRGSSSRPASSLVVPTVTQFCILINKRSVR